MNKKLCSGMIILWVFLLSSIGLKVNVSVEETHYFNHKTRLVMVLAEIWVTGLEKFSIQ